jgi:hypothetical protein
VGEFLSEFFGAVFEGFLGDRYQGRRVRRLQARHQLECGLRVIAGSQPGFSARWTHRTAALSPGYIRMNKRLVVVERVLPAEPRTPSRNEMRWSVNPNTRIVQLKTRTATLEWAVIASQVDWAMASLSPSAER